MRLARPVRERQMLAVAQRVFAERGFRGASVDAIAEGAEISKPMLYAYFGSKEGLYRACMQRSRASLVDALDTAAASATEPDERLWAGVNAFFGFVEDEPEAWAILAGEAGAGGGALAGDAADARRHIAATVSGLLREAAAAEGADDAALAATEPLGLALVGAAESLSRWWQEHPDQPREAVARLAMNFAWMGFGRLVRGEGWSERAELAS
jgi:AcrR family transcriptional regulator